MAASLPALLAGQNPNAAQLAAILTALKAITNWGVLCLNGTASATITGSSYNNINGGTLTWTKNGSAAGSDVLVIGGMSGYGSVSTFPTLFGVNVASTDYDLAYVYLNPGSAHCSLMGTRVLTGLGAGSLTFTPRAKISNGVGTLTVDSNDTVTIVVAELPK